MPTAVPEADDPAEAVRHVGVDAARGRHAPRHLDVGDREERERDRREPEAGRHRDPDAVAGQRVVEHHRRERRGARDDAEQDRRQPERVPGKLGAAGQPAPWPLPLAPLASIRLPPYDAGLPERGASLYLESDALQGVSFGSQSLQDAAPRGIIARRGPPRGNPRARHRRDLRDRRGDRRAAARGGRRGRLHRAQRGARASGRGARPAASFVQADATVAEDVDALGSRGRRGARRARRRSS